MDEVSRILSQSGARFAYLFGSRASGTSRPDSDADIAVMFEREVGLLERSRLALDLADVLGVAEVDLIVLPEASLELRARIVSEGRVLFSGDEARRVTFEAETLVDYMEFRPMLEDLTRAYLARVASRGFDG